MGVVQEFKTFIVRGNVIDLAVGIIIGTAFGTIVKSLVDDIIMPPIGILLGNVDFKDLFWTLRDPTGAGPYITLAEAQAAGAVTMNYGRFFNSVVAFLIVAAAVFLLVRQVNRLKAKPAKEDPVKKECPFCVSTIPLKATRCPQCTSPL